MNCIERFRKRLTTKDAEISKKEEEVRQLQSERAEEMARLVAAEASLESLRAKAAAATNVPAPPSANVAEFRRMQRVQSWPVSGPERSLEEQRPTRTREHSPPMHTRKSRGWVQEHRPLS